MLITRRIALLRLHSRSHIRLAHHYHTMSTAPTTTTAAPSSRVTGFENAVEQLTPIDLTIRGDFPPWLSGILYRSGPGTYSIPSTSDTSKTTEIQHWFDGVAMHHRFEILPATASSGPRVVYRSHKGAASLERRVADAGEYPKELFSFAQRHRAADPCANLFQRFFTTFASWAEALKEAAGGGESESDDPLMHNVSVTLTPDMPGVLAGEEGPGESVAGEERKSPRVIVAKTDGNALQVLEPSTLEPRKFMTYENIDPRLSGQLSAAHACRDAETGELHARLSFARRYSRPAGDFFNFVTEIGAKTTYKVFKIRGDDGKVDVLAKIDAPPSYIHALTMTDRFVVLCVWQAHIKQ